MAIRKAKIAAISCTHAPYTPEATKQCVLDQLANLKDCTHFVHLGDLHDGTAASVHPGIADHTLEDEYRCASQFLADIRSVLPKSVKFIACMGNHDDNILIPDPRRIDAQLHSLVDWRTHKEFGPEYANWQWIPYEKSARGCYRVGRVILFHGFDCGSNSDQIEGIQMVGMSGWHPHSLTVRGHTHRPEHVTQAKRSAKCMLPYWSMNVGTCGPLQPNYMKRKDCSMWNAGMAIIETVWKKPSKITGKAWNAELKEMPR